MQDLVAGAPRTVLEVQRLIHNRDDVDPGFRQPLLITLITVHRTVRLNQELVSHWVGVGENRHVLRVVMMLRGSFGRTELISRTSCFQNRKHTLAGRVLGVGGDYLVLLRGLPREADRGVLGVIMVEGSPAQVWLVEQSALPLVVVIASLIDGSVFHPAGAEEPQLVPLDRAAQASAN